MPRTFDCPKCGAPVNYAESFGHDFSQVFDNNGRYLSLLKLDGHAFGMVFNDKNELFVVARNKVLKLNIAD